jgi:hypothetical protein
MPWTGGGQDPTAGIPPLPGASGPDTLTTLPEGGGALSPEDSALLAAFGRGEVNLGAPGGGAGAPAPPPQRQSVVPAIPEGFQPVYDPLAVENFVTRRQGLGIPSGEPEAIAARLREGDMLYRNPKSGESRWLAMPGGAKDVQATVAAGTAGATTGATAGAGAPYDLVPATIMGPNSTPVTVNIPKSEYLKAFPQGQGAGAGPGAGPPIGTPVGGWQVEPAQHVVATLADQNEAAGRSLTTLGEIRDLMNNVDTGPFAERKSELGSKLIALGLDKDAVNRTLGPVADAEALRKAFWQLGTSQVSSNLGGHPAGFVVEQGLANLPSLGLQKPAIDLMTNMLGMQARRTQAQYRAASQALGTAPAGGYGPGGVYGAVNNAVIGVNDRYNPEAMYGAAKMLTQGGSWSPDMFDANTGAPTAKGQAALDLIEPGQPFFSATGKSLRKDASGKISAVQ